MQDLNDSIYLFSNHGNNIKNEECHFETLEPSQNQDFIDDFFAMCQQDDDNFVFQMDQTIKKSEANLLGSNNNTNSNGLSPTNYTHSKAEFGLENIFIQNDQLEIQLGSSSANEICSPKINLPQRNSNANNPNHFLLPMKEELTILGSSDPKKRTANQGNYVFDKGPRTESSKIKSNGSAKVTHPIQHKTFNHPNKDVAPLVNPRIFTRGSNVNNMQNAQDSEPSISFSTMSFSEFHIFNKPVEASWENIEAFDSPQSLTPNSLKTGNGTQSSMSSLQLIPKRKSFTPDLPTHHLIRKFDYSLVFVPNISWIVSIQSKIYDQKNESRKHPSESKILEDFPDLNHLHNMKGTGRCLGCKVVPNSCLPSVSKNSQLRVCSFVKICPDVFSNALLEYNAVQGPDLSQAIDYDSNWVYEYVEMNHKYLPSLSRFPRYPSTEKEWVECYIYKHGEWAKQESKKKNISYDVLIKSSLPSKQAMLREIREALADSSSIRDRKRSSSKFTFIPPQKAIIGEASNGRDIIEVDVDEKECHCPYCPMDKKNPSRHFYHRKKSAYRGHLMNTHSIFDDGSFLPLPSYVKAFFEYDDHNMFIKSYVAGICPLCSYHIKLTNKNHGLLGFLRHLATHKKIKSTSVS